MGDDGAVGRGNRINGLITPFRSASLEAPAGKNPISHVGKIYNIMAFLTAREIVTQVPEITEAQIYLLSQIGHPLDQPLMATAVVRTGSEPLTAYIQRAAIDIIDQQIQGSPRIRQLLRQGELTVY